MREVLLLTLTMLATRSSISVLGAPVVVAGQVCHVFQYTGQSCSRSTSSSTSPSSASSVEACATSSFCTVPLASCASAASSNSTGCIATPLGTVDCDGSIHAAGNNGTSFQCICNNESKSCPSNGTPLSISFTNGSYSTQNIPASQSGNFSFTWTAETSTSSANSTATATTPVSLPQITAMTTFFGTFSVDEAARTSSSSSNATSVRGQAAHAGNGGGAPEQAVSTSAVSQGQQNGAGVTLVASSGLASLALCWAGLLLLL